MWCLPVGSMLIPPGRLPGEAGFTPRTVPRPEQTTTSRNPGTRREDSAAPENQKQSPSPPPSPSPWPPQASVCGEVHEPAQPAFAGEGVHDGEEALEAVVGRVALDAGELVAVGDAGVVPAARDLDDGRGAVLDAQQGEARLGEQAFVLAWRREEEVADRAARGDLFLGDEPGHDDRVRVEQPSAGPQHAVPFFEHAEATGQVV